MWENFSLIALDVGAFRDAIFAAQRLLELQKKFDDYDVSFDQKYCYASPMKSSV